MYFWPLRLLRCLYHQRRLELRRIPDCNSIIRVFIKKSNGDRGILLCCYTSTNEIRLVNNRVYWMIYGWLQFSSRQSIKSKLIQIVKMRVISYFIYVLHIYSFLLINNGVNCQGRLTVPEESSLPSPPKLLHRKSKWHCFYIILYQSGHIFYFWCYPK